jgi:hypothetical protein
MLISRKQSVSPWQYEVVDETGNVLSRHDRPEDAQSAIDETDRNKPKSNNGNGFGRDKK